ncbi:MAG: LptF/LptG family permease [Desulfobacterales bacterium]
MAFISYFNPRDKTISGIALNYFDDHFKLTRRIDAAEGAFQNGHWVFDDIMEQVLDKKTGSYEVEFHEKKTENLDFLPDDLQRVAKKSEEMSFRELLNYIRNVEAEGYDATPYRVDLQAKFALPAACLIVCIIGAGISVRKINKYGLSVNIALGIVVVFFYYVSHSFCLSLGSAKARPGSFHWHRRFIRYRCFTVPAGSSGSWVIKKEYFLSEDCHAGSFVSGIWPWAVPEKPP